MATSKKDTTQNIDHAAIVEARAEQLSAELGVKVTGLSFSKADGKHYAGYFKPVGRLASIDAADFALAGKHVKAGHMIFATTFLREHSSPEVEKDDSFYRTACYNLGLSVEMAIPDLKKN